MDGNCYKNAIDRLISLGKANGYLTFEQVSDILPDDLSTPSNLTEICGIIDENNIELISKSEEMNRIKISQEEQANNIIKTDSQSDGKADGYDPLKMYLIEMGKMPLLTRYEEVELAKRIEEAKADIQEALCHFNPVIEKLLLLAKKLRKNHIKINDILKKSFEFEDADYIDELDDIEEQALQEETHGGSTINNQIKYEFFRRTDEINKIYKRLRPLLEKDIITSGSVNWERIDDYQNRIREYFIEIPFSDSIISQFVDILREFNSNIISANNYIKYVDSRLGMPLRQYKKYLESGELSDSGIASDPTISCEDIEKFEKGIRNAKRKKRRAIIDSLSSEDEIKDIMLTIDTSYAQAEEARTRLVQSNLRLVVSIAKEYCGRGVQFSDLIQEGNIGVVKAVDKFDYTKGYRFSSYALWFIRRAIAGAVASQGRIIKIPAYLSGKLGKLQKISRRLVQENGREPTVDELAERMDLPALEVRELLSIAQGTIALEAPAGYNNNSHLYGCIEDLNAMNPEMSVVSNNLQGIMDRLLKTLTFREELEIRKRFGIASELESKLEDVGKEFAVTRERIRQIESKALRKLRHPSRSKKLKPFQNNIR